MNESLPRPKETLELPSPSDPPSLALCKLAYNHSVRRLPCSPCAGPSAKIMLPVGRTAVQEQFWAACLHALETLARIGQRYHENALDDEARKIWGPNDEHTNSTPPDRIELYTGRGGGTLLTLADCLVALHAYNGAPDPNAGVPAIPPYPART